MMSPLHIAVLGVLLLAGGVPHLHAETGEAAWLRYTPLEATARSKYDSLAVNLVVLGNSVVLRSAQAEMIRGIEGMTGKALAVRQSLKEPAIVLGTLDAIQAVAPKFAPPDPLQADGFWLVIAKVGGSECLIITSPTDRGVLYGAFAFLSKVARGEDISSLNKVQQPYTKIR